jgi:hypothetical protein
LPMRMVKVEDGLRPLGLTAILLLADVVSMVMGHLMILSSDPLQVFGMTDFKGM